MKTKNRSKTTYACIVGSIFNTCNTLFESNSDQVDLLKRNSERLWLDIFMGVASTIQDSSFIY